MELNQKIIELETQIKLLKNEVKETLLDIRESILDHQNPFTTSDLSSMANGSDQRQEATVQTVALQQEQLLVSVEKQQEQSAVGVEKLPLDQEIAGNQDSKAKSEAIEEEQGSSQEREIPAKTYESFNKTTPPPISESPLPSGGQHHRTLDLATIAGLARWTASGIDRIGRKRIEAIVNIYRAAGHLPSGLDEVLLQLTYLADSNEPDTPVTMTDCIAVLIQLDSLIERGNNPETALLSLLLDDKEESYYR